MSDTEYSSDEEVVEEIVDNEDADIEDIDNDDADDTDTVADENEESDEEISEPILTPVEVDQNIVKKYIIKPEDRRTSDFMSVQEQTEYVSIRATMIAENNDCQVPIDDLIDPIMMARRELMHRKSPIMLEREIGVRKELDPTTKTIVTVKYCEYWDPNVMGFSKIYNV